MSATTTPLTGELLGGVLERATRPDFGVFEARLRSSGYCARPVRLEGHVEICDGHGRRRRVWSTDSEPDGVLRKACGNRHEAVCPPCAERYRQDAYHLISAGLRGGKGVPDSVAEHPAIFATLTAPSFGPVHTRALDRDGQPRRCRPRRDRPVCEHGKPLSCSAVHAEHDECLGEPLCRACFDYRVAVVWNNTLGELWRRTTIYLPRALARLTEMTQKDLKFQVRPAYVKVAEYQRRGLVHLHVLTRLDRAMPAYRADETRPPVARFDVELLEHAFREAVADVSAPVAEELGGGRITWGQALDVRQLASGAERGEIAGYLAKYATKSTEQAGGLLHRIDADQVDHVRVREHVRSYLRTAFELDAAVTAQRAKAPAPKRAEPRFGVEDGWQDSALLNRVRQAMSHDEPINVRLRDGTGHKGRVTRLVADHSARTHAPESEDHLVPDSSPDETALAIEMDGRLSLRLADVKLIRSAAPVPWRDRRDPRLAQCAHGFGYRGHCLTKSRRYSTTFKALREAREAFVHEQIVARSSDAAQRAIGEASEGQRIATFECVGVGHLTAADAYLARSAAARAREEHSAARLALAMEFQTGERAQTKGGLG